MPQQASTKSRVRRQFTESEEDDLVAFLAYYEPSARLTIFPYRKLAEEPRGSNHSSDSWLSRYRRFQPIYDARIMGHILENEFAEREQDGKEMPVKTKREGRYHERSADPEPLQDLPIPLERFMKRPAPISNEDQFVSLNVAVRLLSEAHGVDPEVVYETWERIGDLMLTDVELRGQRGDDDDRVIDNLQTHSAQSSDDERSETSTNSRKRKRSASADPLKGDAGGPASPNPSPKKRVYGNRARRSDIVGVPSSQPGEESDSSSFAPRRIKTPPKHQRGDTEASESPQSSPAPEAPPPALSDESDDEQSDPQSDTPAQPSPQPNDAAEEQDSESESEAAQVASVLSSPARPPPASQGDAADESEEEEEEENEESESGSEAAPVAPRPSSLARPTSQGDAADESGEGEEEEENEDSESGSEAAPVASGPSSPARPPPTSQGDAVDEAEEEEEEEEENDSELFGEAPHTPPTAKFPAAADEDSTSESESEGEDDAQPVSPRSKRVHSSSRSSSERSKASTASQNDSIADDSYIPTQKSLFG